MLKMIFFYDQTRSETTKNRNETQSKQKTLKNCEYKR